MQQATYNDYDQIKAWYVKMIGESELKPEESMALIRECDKLASKGFLRGDISEELAKRSFFVVSKRGTWRLKTGREIFNDLYL
jgi:hypothetical protein